MKEKNLHGRKINRLLSLVLAVAMVFTMMPLTGMTVYADGASSTYTSGTVDVTTLKVGDTIYRGVTLIDNKNIVCCATCHQIWFTGPADELCVVLRERSEHSGHANSVGWYTFNWHSTSDKSSAFKEGVAYTIMRNDFLHTHNSNAYGMNATQHWTKCSDDEDNNGTPENHDWSNGICSVCYYSCTHTGGTSTCQAEKLCTICGASYGEKAAHDWTYSAENDNLTAECNTDGCTYKTTGVTLTIIASACSGSAIQVTAGSLSQQAAWKAVFGDNSIPTVHYVGRGNTSLEDTTDAPTAVGTYTAMITVGTVTATADYEIKAEDPVVPIIDKQPEALTVTEGEIATFTVSARVTDDGTISYQWYIDRNTGSFVAIEGATNASYTITATTDSNGYKYYCVVTNTKNSQAKEVSSNTVELTVNKATPTHTHNYQTTWSSDATQHWHECTSTTGTCDIPKKDTANHTWNNGSCSVCTYVCTHGGVTSGTCTTCGKYIAPTTQTEKYTILVKNENAVNVEAEIKNGIADLSEISAEIIDKVVNNTDKESKVDTISVDLSGAKQEVTGVTLSKKTVEALAKIIADTDNGIETVTIELSKATVVLDHKTLTTLIDQAKGSQIELVVTDTQQINLNSAQQNALNEHHVARTFEAYITSDGQRIHDFKGGKAVVSIDFTPEAGKDTRYYHMFYVANNGVLTRHETRYEKGKLWYTTTHFSDFAVIYDTTETTETEIQPKEDEKKDDSTETDAKVTLDTTYGKLRLRVPTSTKTTNVLKWTKIPEADGYVIYGNKCNANGKTYEMVQQVEIKDGATTTWTDKSLTSGTYYKYYIKAYKLVDGKKVWVAKSKVVHSTTTGGKYGNAKSVKVNKTSLTLAVGEKSTITAEQIKNDLPIKNHRKIKFESSNSEVASVSSMGVIKAKSKGTCYIYVYAQNGLYKRIIVTVK